MLTEFEDFEHDEELHMADREGHWDDDLHTHTLVEECFGEGESTKSVEFIYVSYRTAIRSGHFSINLIIIILLSTGYEPSSTTFLKCRMW